VIAELERGQQRLAEIPGELQKLRKSGQKKMSRSDEDSRFLHRRDGLVRGYTAEAVASEDGLIVGAAGRGVIRSGFSAGARDEGRTTRSGSLAHLSPGTQTDAAAIAFTGGTETVRTAQRTDRASVRNPKRASRPAQILSSRTGGREHRVLADGAGL
jgi:hypothetical protein